MHGTAVSDRVALITGGAKGIGRALAESLAADGWAVAVCYRTSAGAAAELVRRIESAGGRALAERCDVSDPAACAALVERVVGSWGRLDALVNAAGPYRRAPLLDETPEAWRAMFDHNLHPVLWLSRLVAPLMQRQRWGRILNFGVANAERPSAPPDVAAYHLAKAAVVTLTRTLAKVLGPHGITVNAISPGFLDSGGLPREELERMAHAIPAGYIGSVDDAVAAARFLLSDEARYVNGANLPVSGGWGV